MTQLEITAQFLWEIWATQFNFELSELGIRATSKTWAALPVAEQHAWLEVAKVITESAAPVLAECWESSLTKSVAIMNGDDE